MPVAWGRHTARALCHAILPRHELYSAATNPLIHRDIGLQIGTYPEIVQSCDSVGTVHILLPVGFTTVTLLQKSNAARARCVRGPIQRTRLFMVLPKLLYVVESAQSFWPPLQLL
eukprot:2040719-Rhodomonas_salina.1